MRRVLGLVLSLGVALSFLGIQEVAWAEESLNDGNVATDTDGAGPTSGSEFGSPSQTQPESTEQNEQPEPGLAPSGETTETSRDEGTSADEQTTAPSESEDGAPTEELELSDEEIPEAVGAPESSNTWQIGSPRRIGFGWNGSIYNAGNFDRYGADDVFLVRPNGDLHFYPRTEATWFNGTRKIGRGWNNMRILMTGADFDGDGYTDILAIRYDADLYLYRGNGDGGFKSSKIIGYGWHDFQAVVLVPKGPGGNPALIGQRGDTTWVYPTNGSGKWGTPYTVELPGGITSYTFCAGDLAGTGYSTLMRVNGSNLEVLSTTDYKSFSAMEPIKLNGLPVKYAAINGFSSGASGYLDVVNSDRDFLQYEVTRKVKPADQDSPPLPRSRDISFSASKRAGSGWPGSGVYGLGDFDRDDNPDLGIIKSDGSFMFYRGSGTGGFRSPYPQIGWGWGSLTVLSGVDADGDGTPDVIARTTSGKLLLYPGSGRGGFSSSYVIGYGWQNFTHMWLVRQGPGGSPAIYVRNPDGTVGVSKSNGKGTFYSVVPTTIPASIASDMPRAFASDDWNNDGRSDLLVIRSNGNLVMLPQLSAGGFGEPQVIGWGWHRMRSLHPGAFSASSKQVYAVHEDGTLYLYTATYRGSNRGFSTPAGYAPRVQVNGSWLTHPISWTGQPDGSTCGPTSMYMTLRYLDAGNSRYDGKPLTVWNLAGPSYANVGSGYTGGTSWEGKRLSVGLNRWRGTNDYQQWTFPSGRDFDAKVKNSFYTGRPVLVDTIENYGGPHYNGHVGTSSHIIVAYRYHSSGTVGFVDPGGPGSAISGYSANRYFDYHNAVQFGNNFLGNYGGGGHGMVY